MKQAYYLAGAVVLVIVLIVGWRYYVSTLPSKLDSFAQCMTDSGAVFYGAFWCPHCQNTKKLLGNAMKYINYVECSAPDGKTQLPVCAEKGVQGYPTWIFGDGTRETGELSLETLAQKTGCVLPVSAL